MVYNKIAAMPLQAYLDVDLSCLAPSVLFILCYDCLWASIYRLVRNTRY